MTGLARLHNHGYAYVTPSIGLRPPASNQLGGGGGRGMEGGGEEGDYIPIATLSPRKELLNRASALVTTCP